VTPERLLALCRSPEDWAALADALRPLPEAQRAELAEPATWLTQLDRSARPRADFDDSAVAIAALGVLTDLHQIAIYGFYFRTVAHEAEPYLLQVVRDWRPRWLGRLVKELLRDRWEVWRPAYLLVREGLVERPTSVGFLTASVFGLVGAPTSGPRTVAQALREEPELLDAVVWPLLSVETAGRRLRDHDLRPVWHHGSQLDSSFEATWTGALLDQVARGGIDRDRLLDTALAAFLLDWPTVDQAWFLHLHDALAPTLDELADRRTTYLRLLGSGYGPAVVLGQRCLSTLLQAGRLPADELLQASPAAVLRKEKALVLGQLRLLEQLAAADPGRTAKVAQVVGLALQHPRADVQEQALRAVRRLAPEVLPAAMEDSSGLLSPTLRRQTGPATDARPRVAAPRPRPEPAPVVPVADVEELVELLLRTCASPDPLQVERAYEGLVRLGRSIPPRELRALQQALTARGWRSGGLGLASAVHTLVRGELWGAYRSDVSRQAYDADGSVRQEPLWRLEQMVVRRSRESPSRRSAGAWPAWTTA
jgi:hypothetical protein